jgi:hypothetical protein
MSNCPFIADKGYNFPMNCTKSECALWSAVDKKCSYVIVAESVVNIALQLGDISDTLKMIRMERG